MSGHAGIGPMETDTYVSIVKLKQVHELTHPMMYKVVAESNEPEVLLGPLRGEAEEEYL